MNKFIQLSVLSAALLSAPAIADTVFVEQNGRLIVEIESAEAISNWHNTTAFPGYKGSSAYEWTRPGTNGARNADAAALVYHFTINTPGNYEFRWRSRIGEGTNGTEANDSWVRFPTGSNVSGEHPLNGWTKGYMNQVGAWSWRTVTVDHVGEAMRQHFTAGDHTLEISGRSKGHVLDRFVLYKYDAVNFNDSVFTNAPQSEYTGDEIEVVIPEPVPEQEPDPEPVAAPEPALVPNETTDQNTVVDNTVNEVPVAGTEQQFQIPANQIIANECSDGVISLQPISNITVESSEIGNSGELHIDGDAHTALLKFDLSNVPSTMTSAILTLTVGTDAGEGAVVLSAASHSDWDEIDASQLPDISHLIGTFSGSWSEQTRYGFAFDPALTASEKATLALEMAQGSDGITIIPSVSDHEPRLQLTGDGDFCADYEANLESLDSEEKSAIPTEVETDSDGGGSLQLLELLLLTLSLATAGRLYKRGTALRR